MAQTAQTDYPEERKVRKRAMSSLRIRFRSALLFLLLLAAIIAYGLTGSWRRKLSMPVTTEEAYSYSIEQAEKQADARPGDAEVRARLGLLYKLGGHHVAAMQQLKKAVGLGLDTSDVQTALGDCYLHLARKDQALRAYARVVEIDGNKLEQFVRLAETYLRSGQSDKALGSLNQIPQRLKPAALGGQGDDPETLGTLAMTYARAGDRDTSLLLADRWAQVSPKDPGPHAVRGKVLLSAGRVIESVAALRQAIRLAPRLADLHYLVAVALWQQDMNRNLKDVIHHLQQAVDLEPNLGKGYYHLGVSLQHKKEWSRAARAFERAYSLGSEPLLSLRRAAECWLKSGSTLQNTMQGTYRMGLYYKRAGNYPRALKEFSKMTTVPEHCASGYVHIAGVYQAMRKPRMVIDSIQKALKLEPTSADLHLRLADAYSATNDLENRADAINEAISLDPKFSAYGYAALASMYTRSGRYQKAEALLRKCIALEPKSPVHHLDIGLVCYAQRNDPAKLREAIKHMEKATVMEPENHVPAFYLGTAYLDANQLENAARAFEHCVDVSPGYGEAYLSLGQVYLKQGRKDLAQEMMGFYRGYQRFEQEAELLVTRARARRTDPDAQFALGEFYFRAGDYESAKRQFEQAARLRRHWHKAYRRLSECYLELGRPEDAGRIMAMTAVMRGGETTKAAGNAAN